MASLANQFAGVQKMGDFGAGEVSRYFNEKPNFTDDELRQGLDSYQTAGRDGGKGFTTKSVDWDQAGNRFTTETSKVPDAYKKDWIEIPGEGRSYFSRTGAASPNSPEALEKTATEARQRADTARTVMRASTPQVAAYDPGNQDSGQEIATNYGNDSRRWMYGFVDSLKSDALQQAAEGKQHMFSAIRGLPDDLAIPKPLDVDALYKRYSAGLA